MTTATVNEGLGVKQKKSRKSKTDDGTLLPTSTLGVPQTSKEHVANDDQLTKSTIKSKSKRSKGEEGAVSAHTTNEAVTEQRPKKKKRKRTADGDEAQVEGLDIDGESKKKKKKKKREKKAVSDDDEEVGDQVGDQSALKVADSDDIPAEVFQSEKATKKEKKKRRKESQSEGAQALDDTLEPKKKKKRSGNTDFPDPEDDASLTDQARKGEHIMELFVHYYSDPTPLCGLGLLYVFSQFEDPDAWKFNKARQNWLIRNVWSDQIVSEVVPRNLSLSQGLLTNSADP